MTSVYEFWAADGSCLYVGCTDDLPSRLRWHEREQPWFDQIARMAISVWPETAIGFEVEAALIRTLNPIHNRALTDHDTPRRLPCRRCRAGHHPECLGVNREQQPCRCAVCSDKKAAA